MLISLLALINILRKAHPEETLTIENAKNKPNLFWIKLYQKNEGIIHRLTYDASTQTAFGISEEWIRVLDKVVEKAYETPIKLQSQQSEDDWMAQFEERINDWSEQAYDRYQS